MDLSAFFDLSRILLAPERCVFRKRIVCFMDLPV